MELELYEEGRSAYHHCQRLAECPYSDERREYWARGWHQAQSEQVAWYP